MIDGVKFAPWTPKDEIKDFHPIIKKFSKEIFGDNTAFIDINPKLISEAGIGSKPDGFVIDPTTAKLYVVEIELSEHNPYKHINDQLTRFINGLENLATKNKLVEALFDEIDSDRALKWFFEDKVKENLHKWLSKLLGQPPTIAVIIEKKTDDVCEACRILMKSFDTKIIEFSSFQRDDAPTVFAHLFEPLAYVEKAQDGMLGESTIEDKAQHIAADVVRALFLSSLSDLTKMGCSIKPLQGRWLSVWKGEKRFMYVAARDNWFICQIEKRKGEWSKTIRVKTEDDWKNVQNMIKPLIES